MRPQRAYGRPSTTVFPPNWATDLRPSAEGTQTSPCTIRHPGSVQTWSAALEQNVETPNDPYFTGLCRVQALIGSHPLEADAAGEAMAVSGYLVTVPATVTPQVGDLVTVASIASGATVADPMLDGTTLVVRDIAVGSQVVERDLYCTPI